MFLTSLRLKIHPLSFPRIRGDVPSVQFFRAMTAAFSPHTRGCSENANLVYRTEGVFPAYAGMFRRCERQQSGTHSFPRIRGDVPRRRWTKLRRISFSPHTRGCSVFDTHSPRSYLVFPAYAGMFRCRGGGSAVGASFPRIRGDVPQSVEALTHVYGFSPHTRGCSGHIGDMLEAAAVFPAYAGMFRRLLIGVLKTKRFPRIRGDVPE